jgi:predicted dienelactone hydrolase
VAQVREDTLALGGRTAIVWRNTSATQSSPVIVFSHGLGGCPTQSRFLTQGLAAHGYVVIAPYHRDAGCRGKKPPTSPVTPFASPGRWTDQTYADRAEDVRAVVGSLPSSSLGAAADLDRLAVAGHSLGGYTALSVGGAWALMRMPRVRAVLALAPYAAPFVTHRTLGELTVPVMFQSGALDDGITQTVAKRGGAFDAVRGPKYFVEFAGARHSSWGNKPHAAHDVMLAYAAAFFDRHLRGMADSAVLGRRLTGVADLRASESR